jgi:hypothetical protein
MEPVPALEPLLIKAKPLAEILTDRPERWTELAKKLAVAYPPTQGKDVVYPLCTVYYAFNKNRLISPTQPSSDTLVTQVVDFLEVFMNANGQWAYIKDQPWYKSRDYVIGIDVNFYPNRAQNSYKLAPQFHKDTGGNNIFVNLIFDNQHPIEATEWFVDVEDPGGSRAAWQEKLLPTTHREQLASLRHYLKDKRARQQSELRVEGGVLEGKQICVSWVDDLVWHATPSLNERIVYTTDIAKADHGVANGLATYLADWTAKNRPLDDREDYKYLSYKSSTGHYIHLVELVGSIADDPQTKLVSWLKGEEKLPQDIDCDVAIKAWMSLYTDAKTFEHDVTLRGRTQWRMTGFVAEAIAYDQRLKDDPAVGQSPHIIEPTVGISKLRRTNSAGSEDLKQRLKEVAEANANVPRRFIRTWVRILPRTSDEVKKAGFQVQ